jgi:hypothetical protein
MTSLERLKIRIPEEENEDILKELLTSAKDVVLSHLYPLVDDYEGLTIPRKYNTLLLDIAVEMYNKQGAEGETSHSENGISRSYENAYISQTLLSQIIPYGNVVGREADE